MTRGDARHRVIVLSVVHDRQDDKLIKCPLQDFLLDILESTQYLDHLGDDVFVPDVLTVHLVLVGFDVALMLS